MKAALPDFQETWYLRVLWTYWLVDFSTRFSNFYYMVLGFFFSFSFSTELLKLSVSVVRHMHIFPRHLFMQFYMSLLGIHFSVSFPLGVLLCSIVSTSQMLFGCFHVFFSFFFLFHLSFRIVNFWYVFSIPKVVALVWCRSWMCSWASFRSCLSSLRKELEAAYAVEAVVALPASSLVSRSRLQLSVLERGNVQWQADLPGGRC